MKSVNVNKAFSVLAGNNINQIYCTSSANAQSKKPRYQVC